MNGRLVFRYPTGMALTWTVRMLFAMLFLAATAVMHTRLQEAIARNYRFLMVDASDMIRPILE